MHGQQNIKILKINLSVSRNGTVTCISAQGETSIGELESAEGSKC